MRYALVIMFKLVYFSLESKIEDYYICVYNVGSVSIHSIPVLKKKNPIHYYYMLLLNQYPQNAFTKRLAE